MKAMVYHGPTDVRYEAKPDPEIQHPEDVDEFVGVVEDAGTEVSDAYEMFAAKTDDCRKVVLSP